MASEFYPNSPGWNILLGLSWRAGGYWGLFLLTFVTLTAYFGLAYAASRRLGARPLPSLAALTLTFAFAFPMLSARATTAVQILLLLALITPALWRRHAGRHTPLVNGLVSAIAGAGLSICGNWVHLSWIAMAPAVAFAWVVYWLAQRGDDPSAVGGVRLKTVIVCGTMGLLAGPLASPYGLTIGLKRALETKRTCEGAILEWVSPFTPSVPPQWPAVALISIPAIISLSAWLTRRLLERSLGQRFALIACIGCIGVPAALGGYFAIRFLGVAVMTMAPVMAWGATVLTESAQRAAARASDSWLGTRARLWTGGQAWRVVLSAVAIILLPGVLWLGPGAHARPAESDALATLPSGCRLFSQAGVAAVAILERPDVPVWFDGRADYFGRERLLEANGYYLARQPSAAPPGATCVVLWEPTLRSGLPRLTARLNADPDWDYRGRVSGLDVWLKRGN